MHVEARRKPYLVTVHPEGRWWHIRVPELGHGAVSQALTLNEVPDQARDLISLWLNAPAARVRFRILRRSGQRPAWADTLRAAHSRD